MAPKTKGREPPTAAQEAAPPRQSAPRRETHSDLYGISRRARDPDKGQQGWIVHLSRGGRMIQTSFADSTYGSKAASLYVARAYRDAVLEIVPPLTRAEMRQVQRKTAHSAGPDDGPRMTGVHYTKASRGRAASWVARIELPADDSHPTRPAKGAKRARPMYSA